VGRASRERPKRLAEKLLQIRNGLGLTQNEMVEQLGIGVRGHRNYLSDFENGVREPSLPLLLRYARVAGICVDVLIDDQAELPKKLPAKPRHRP
jgi:transcriptional regulator with XRE-family HTH domain